MSSLKNRTRRHSILRRLLGVVSASLIIGAGPAEASVPTSRQALEARVIDIRAALNASTEKASESAPDTIVAQWGNWNNWNNWAKWNNWPNWGNWGNWLNR